jgi:ABC-type glutathione transport system ATPase component
MSALVEVTGLRKHFPLDEKGMEVVAVNDISFEIGRGETFGLVGESGSGKTTVGRCILRLLEPTAGQILFDGQDITGLDADHLRGLRPRMQLVFQEPYASLNPRMSVRQTVEEPLALHDVVTGPKRRERLQATLESVQLSTRHLDRYPSELSPSEQQRVGIARAIVTDPTLLLCDEPTGDLDRKSGDEILDLLQTLNREHGKTIVMVTHDPHAAERARRTLHLEKGKLMESAVPA